MSVQLNIRLNDELARLVDELAAEDGLSRPDVVREALRALAKKREDDRIREQYRIAYTLHPQTEDELEWADYQVDRAIREEPWEKWW